MNNTYHVSRNSQSPFPVRKIVGNIKFYIVLKPKVANRNSDQHSENKAWTNWYSGIFWMKSPNSWATIYNFYSWMLFMLSCLSHLRAKEHLDLSINKDSHQLQLTLKRLGLLPNERGWPISNFFLNRHPWLIYKLFSPSTFFEVILFGPIFLVTLNFQAKAMHSGMTFFDPKSWQKMF